MASALAAFFGGGKKGVGSDSKYFSAKRSDREIEELSKELISPKIDEMKEAIKKVIANITVGKDMSPLLPQLVNCLRTDNLEAKKLVYLYLINYAKTNPEMTMMAANAFVKDTRNPNPMLRALALRTMGAIRVDKITEQLCTPLKHALTKETDPYVRKTAAICVAKLFDTNPELAHDQGFISDLNNLISDPNPTVVANAVAALAEIQEGSKDDVFVINTAALTKLTTALNECNEWGQVFILDALARYEPASEREAESIIDRVLPRLKHANAAVVLSAVKIVLLMLDRITSPDTVTGYLKKLSPPLVTLAQAPQHEIQYVALRNISLVVQKRPGLLASKVNVFFCKYNDPIYVKLEKLELLVRLVTDKTIDAVLRELRQYAQEVDVEYVRRAVRTVGRCAIKLEKQAEKCIMVMLQLLKTKVSYVVQEAVVVTKDIFRRYPNRYESVIAVMCKALDNLDEPEAKASLVWIVGEYADRVVNAAQLLELFLKGFKDETAQVQLALLTSIVKLYLKKPKDALGANLVREVLKLATEESDNPDLRDRGYIYWRLLSTAPKAAKLVILAEKPVISDDTNSLPPSQLDALILQLSTLAAVYHKPPSAFVRRSAKVEFGDSDDDSEEDDSDDEGDSGDEGEGAGAGEEEESDDDDLLGGGEPQAGPASGAGADTGPPAADADPGDGAGSEDDEADLFGADPSPGGAPKLLNEAELQSVGSKGGLAIKAALVSVNGVPNLKLEVQNDLPAGTAVQHLDTRLNVNSFGLVPSTLRATFPYPVGAGSSGSILIPLEVGGAGTPKAGAAAAQAVVPRLQLAFREPMSKTVVQGTVALWVEGTFPQDAAYPKQEFGPAYKACTGEGQEAVAVARGLPNTDVDAIKAALGSAGLSYVGKRALPGDKVGVYFACKAYGAVSASSGLGPGQVPVLVETQLKAGMPVCKITARSPEAGYADLGAAAVERLLRRMPEA